MLLKAFTVTKNEYDLIEDWIKYYRALCGAGNIFIIDNGSTDQRVLDVYKKYYDEINLIVRPGYEKAQQGEHFTAAMYQNRDAECLICLDTDEFLVVHDGREIGVDKEKIRVEMQGIVRDYNSICLSWLIQSCSCDVDKIQRPATELTRFYRNDWKNKAEYYFGPSEYKKYLFRGKDFISTHNGCHTGWAINGLRSVQTNLGILHFHDTGKFRNLEKAKQVCLGYKYIDISDDNNTALRKLNHCRNTYGCHRVEQYIDYLEKGRHWTNIEYNYETNIFKEYMLTL